MRATTMLVAPLIVAACCHHVVAQCEPEEVAKLLASDGAAGDGFGVPLALDGDTAVFGARFDDDNGTDSGSVYIFERFDGVWTQTAKLIASDGAIEDNFGNAVSISGRTVVVGAARDDDMGTDSGSVYVFELVDGAWSEVAKLLGDDTEKGDRFGNSVSIDGDTVVVGSPLHHIPDEGDPPGAAYIFECIDGVWIQSAQLIGQGSRDIPYFGSAVSLRGDTVLIGEPSGGIDWGGAVYFYERDGDEWTRTAAYYSGGMWGGFGGSVALDGDTAIVGEPLAWGNGDEETGKVYLFERMGGIWGKTRSISLPDGARDDYFGASVAIRGETAIATVRFDDDLGENSGSAYLIEKAGGVWGLGAKLTASDGAADDAFGISVAMDNNTIFVGAYRDDDMGTDSGSVYVFDLGCGCPADFNGDGVIDSRDVLLFFGLWVLKDPIADWNEDGLINSRDVLAFLNDWNQGC